MKTNKIMALLAVCGLFAGSASIVANYHRHEGSCRTCNDKCDTCPRKHESYCEAKPNCVKYVEAYHAPCKQCTTNCSYTCPVGYETRPSSGEGSSMVSTVDQDEDWKQTRSSKSYSDDNGSSKKTYKKGGKRMKASTEVVE